jgi:hypothetical protein
MSHERIARCSAPKPALGPGTTLMGIEARRAVFAGWLCEDTGKPAIS